MAGAPAPIKLHRPRWISDCCCAGSENFKPVDVSFLGSVGCDPLRQTTWFPGFSPSFQGSEQFCLAGVPGTTGVWKNKQTNKQNLLHLVQCLPNRPPSFLLETQSPGGVGTRGNLLVCRLRRPGDKRGICAEVRQAQTLMASLGSGENSPTRCASQVR
uniref:Uncharacterized protein n=1 Tax=Macaca mulatta TaxID=9544 RepID=A0A5F7ZEJ9_MACMU